MYSWFLWAMGGFFLLIAKRAGYQLANGLKEPDDLPEQITARIRWNVFVLRAFGLALIAWGAWAALRL